ncbi:hypothetical protein [Achromobacter insuavis]|uniref:hypothetical protein n=1 Tax=Achromobacter insuavis TaxID=1287735 RepID=UPI001EEDC006|nr:hypothetical protein [Achromobacter insuavis]
MLRYQLTRPFGYIFIQHRVKKVVDWYLPALLATIAVAVLFPFRGIVNIWGEQGLVVNVQAFVQSLPGFYIAALAAIATFGQKGTLDTLMPEPTPTIETRFGGAWVVMGLTRRRFLCLLFAYLTALSVCLTVFSLFVRAVVGVKQMMPHFLGEATFYAMTYAYLIFFFQMVVTTLWGLYYLSDRIHQPDPHEPVDPDGSDIRS